MINEKTEFFLHIQSEQEQEAISILKKYPNLAHERTKLLLAGHLGGQKAEASHTALTAAATMGMSHLLVALLDYSVDLNERGMFGETALHDAAWFGHAQIAKLLLQHGASPHIRCLDNQKEAWFWAIHGSSASSWAGEHEQIAVLNLLLEAGSTIDWEEIYWMAAESTPFTAEMNKWLATHIKRPFGEETVHGNFLFSFVDITCFVKETNGLSDKQVWDYVQQFYQIAADIITFSGGQIIKQMGDGIFIVYPIARKEIALVALPHLRDRVNNWLQQLGWKESHLLVKIAEGTAVGGIIGDRFDQRFDFLGAGVNKAALASPID